MDDEGKPFIVESPTRIRLSPMARQMARMHGMTENEMAKHLLQQHQLQQAGLTQREGEN